MNLYENTPDARQTDATATAPEHSLFRTRYRQLSADEMALHDAIKGKADELAALFARIDTAPRVPLPSAGIAVLEHVSLNRGAHVTLALRHLEDAVYRAVKALTA